MEIEIERMEEDIEVQGIQVDTFCLGLKCVLTGITLPLII